MTHRRSLTKPKAPMSASMSNFAKAEEPQVSSRARSSRRTLDNLAGSLIRCDLMRSMVILSSNSPGEMGTLISLMRPS